MGKDWLTKLRSAGNTPDNLPVKTPSKSKSKNRKSTPSFPSTGFEGHALLDRPRSDPVKFGELNDSASSSESKSKSKSLGLTAPFKNLRFAEMDEDMGVNNPKPKKNYTIPDPIDPVQLGKMAINTMKDQAERRLLLKCNHTPFEKELSAAINHLTRSHPAGGKRLLYQLTQII